MREGGILSEHTVDYGSIMPFLTRGPQDGASAVLMRTAVEANTVLTILAFLLKCHKSTPADNDWPEEKMISKLCHRGICTIYINNIYYYI